MGILEVFPERMRVFDRSLHDALVLDDVRDFNFLESHQEKLQGLDDAIIEFASTTGGTRAFYNWLWRIPIVVTANYSTRNLHFLDDHDFFGREENRVVVHFSARQPAGANAPAAPVS